VFVTVGYIDSGFVTVGYIDTEVFTVGYIDTEIFTVGYIDTGLVDLGYVDTEMVTVGYNVLPVKYVELLGTLIGSPPNCSMLLSSVCKLACLQ
jgi:hypothetical protein